MLLSLELSLCLLLSLPSFSMRLPQGHVDSVLAHMQIYLYVCMYIYIYIFHHKYYVNVEMFMVMHVNLYQYPNANRVYLD